MARITYEQLGRKLYAAAGILRSKTAGQDYKTYILTLMFFKRLCDQYDREVEEKIAEVEKERGKPFTDAQRKALGAKPDMHRFVIPDGCHWRDVVATSTGLGEKLTRATLGVAKSNSHDFEHVFTVDWNAPVSPNSTDRLVPDYLIAALLNHFDSIKLSNADVPGDVLGQAYEYMIGKFADDAGEAAGEFFTPGAIVDTLVRIVEPRPGEEVFDPTCGSGGMLVHAADFVREQGGDPSNRVTWFGQELMWPTAAIAKINLILHDLDGTIKGGRSSITSPQFLDARGGLRRFDVVLANFPFSSEGWWLSEDKTSKDDVEKAKKTFKKEGFTDKYGRFVYGMPPASTGDYAFIQHVVASMNDRGRAGVVCPQGVLFRGQAEVEEETGELDAKGNPKVRRRKADDEHLIRKGLVDARLLEAVVALPLNLFNGTGLPACLLLFRKVRPAAHRDKILFIYAARHCRELSAKNELRPQDVMRVLVHYHAWGDASRVEPLLALHTTRIEADYATREVEEVDQIGDEYIDEVKKRDELAALTDASAAQRKALDRVIAKLRERDERIATARRRFAESRQALRETADDLRAIYAAPALLARHARLVDREEILENEYNLNVARYVDTFEAEPHVDVAAVFAEFDAAEHERQAANKRLRGMLTMLGYSA